MRLIDKFLEFPNTQRGVRERSEWYDTLSKFEQDELARQYQIWCNEQDFLEMSEAFIQNAEEAKALIAELLKRHGVE